ncbi:hypothetical protein HY500_00610 [Candidatus Woesearchaeota archaeon]|nr:hypothetical protein [Candidatus Woesearchaeota archaeon]
MGFLQSLSKFFGRVFFGIGLSLLLLGVFAQMAFGTIDSLKGKTATVVEDVITSPENLNLLLQNVLPPGVSLDEFKQACAATPNTEECQQIKQLSEDPKGFIKSQPDLQKQIDDQVKQADQQVNDVIDRAKNYGSYVATTFIISIILILLGIILVYVGFMNWKESAYILSVKGAIATGLAAVYYKIAQSAVNGDLLSSYFGENASLIEPIQKVLAEWINPIFNKMFFLSTGLAVLFIIFAVGMYFFKKKDLKKGNKESKLL